MIHTFKNEQFRLYLKESFLYTTTPNKFANEMEYKNTKLCIKHFHKIVSDPLLALYEKKLDFNPKIYFEKLLNIVDYEEEKKNVFIKEVTNFIEIYEQNKPYIFIETEFNAKTIDLPIHALSLFAIQKKISLNIEHFSTNIRLQTQFVQTIINHHVTKIGKYLPLWGNIYGYSFYYNKDLTIYFSADGEQIIQETTYNV